MEWKLQDISLFYKIIAGSLGHKKNKPDLSRKITHRRESGRRGEKKKFKKSQISSFSEIWQQPAF